MTPEQAAMFAFQIEGDENVHDICSRLNDAAIRLRIELNRAEAKLDAVRQKLVEFSDDLEMDYNARFYCDDIAEFVKFIDEG